MLYNLLMSPVIYIIVIVLITGGIIGRFFYNAPQPSPAVFSPTPSPSASPTPSPSNKPSTKPKAALPTTTPKIKTTPTPIPTSIPTSTPFPKITCNINSSTAAGWSPLYVDFSYSASDQSRITGSQWDLDGDNNYESETSTPNFVYKDVKSYEAKLKLKLSDGNYSETCSKTIVVNPPSVACDINANVSSGTAPLSVNFVYGARFYGSSDDYVTDVQWDFNGDETWDTPYDYASQHPPVYTFANPGNYTARMHLKTNKGLETSICTKSISVN